MKVRHKLLIIACASMLGALATSGATNNTVIVAIYGVKIMGAALTLPPEMPQMSAEQREQYELDVLYRLLQRQVLKKVVEENNLRPDPEYVAKQAAFSESELFLKSATQTYDALKYLVLATPVYRSRFGLDLSSQNIEAFYNDSKTSAVAAGFTTLDIMADHLKQFVPRNGLLERMTDETSGVSLQQFNRNSLRGVPEVGKREAAKKFLVANELPVSQRVVLGNQVTETSTSQQEFFNNAFPPINQKAMLRKAVLRRIEKDAIFEDKKLRDRAFAIWGTEDFNKSGVSDDHK